MAGENRALIGRSLRQRNDRLACQTYKEGMKAAGPIPLDTLDRRIEQLLSEDPRWSQSLVAWRMACVGCDLAGHHTLRQALEIYQIDPQAFWTSFEGRTAGPGRPAQSNS